MNLTDDRFAADKVWDVAVIGAGPAGSVAASLLTARGKRVLLLEKSQWPRQKVCGGCLNGTAVDLLKGEGLGEAVHGGQPIDRAIWYAGKHSLVMSAPGGMAVLRSDLDSRLVSCAVEQGCAFLSQTAAKLLPRSNETDHRILQLNSDGITRNVPARIVLACDGTAGTSLDSEPWAKWRIQRDGWMGISFTTDAPGGGWDLNAIHMHVGRGGYVGAVRVSHQKIHFAAALDPSICRAVGGPVNLIESILRFCGRNAFPTIDRANLRGSGVMTRQRKNLGGERVLAVGDACGYVEPFTGEGMEWAVRSAIEVATLLSAVDQWSADIPEQWAAVHRRRIENRQRWCNALRPLMHHPSAVAMGIITARVFPAIGEFLSTRFCRRVYPSFSIQGDSA